MRSIAAVVALSVSLLGAADPKKEARDYFDRAERDYKLGRFEDALANYSRAYERLPAPAFLFNIGQCHRNLGNHERAIYFLRGYLRDDPSAPDKQRVEDLIAELELKVAAERTQREQEERAEEERLRREEEQRAKARLAEVPEAAFVPAANLGAPQAGAPGASEEPGYHEAWWFWALIGAAAVGTAGVIIAAGAGNDPEPPGLVGRFDYR